MKHEFRDGRHEGLFVLTNFQRKPSLDLLDLQNLYKIIWCTSGEQHLIVDGCSIILKKDQVLFSTPSNLIQIPKEISNLRSFLFSREFFCIRDHDAEVSCMGLLFYGSSSIPIITLDENDQKYFEALFIIFREEFNTNDMVKGEMLRTLLKRLLITSTTLVKKDQELHQLSSKQVDLIRKFNVLVEQHFKEKHQVSEYADLLSKSPKTLSNFFKKHKVTSPLKIINERIALEAKKLLQSSNLTAEEIAYKLGYKEPSHFSKFFKKRPVAHLFNIEMKQL
ncbi:transcriptional regulator, AraC family [Nonlabens sp. Hel1_33_55]|uniref:helix-turn-helix domain-containing protein n=1 Tax=Nonlabens sp. Hel1_33_55 TaxID=1336802 RepID=UPI000875BC96|nr:AraC family transcriptional regulator [Nonlabens sp. Hel1_33_55]SCY23302.1 transcriptional regulator, AraC family [Nonlabens sp. Hel1_33_55]